MDVFRGEIFELRKLELPCTDCADVIRWAETWDWGVGEILGERLSVGQFSDLDVAFVATIAGEYAGFCVLEKTDNYGVGLDFSPFITTVYVEPKFRGRRISGKVIDAACDYALSLGFGAVYLISNERDFYEKYGFEPFTRTLTAFGGTEQVYRKYLRLCLNLLLHS